jgi:hypothetical protein
MVTCVQASCPRAGLSPRPWGSPVDVGAGLGTNGLVRDQRYQTDHDAGMPMPD